MINKDNIEPFLLELTAYASKVYNIPLEQIRNQQRTRRVPVVRIRQLIIYICMQNRKSKDDFSLADVGKVFDLLDHSSVINNRDNGKDMLKYGSDMEKRMYETLSNKAKVIIGRLTNNALSVITELKYRANEVCEPLPAVD